MVTVGLKTYLLAYTQTNRKQRYLTLDTILYEKIKLWRLTNCNYLRRRLVPHRLRTCCTTSPTDKLTTILQFLYTTNLPHRNATAQHLDMSRCWDVAIFLSVGGEFVVELL